MNAGPVNTGGARISHRGWLASQLCQGGPVQARACTAGRPVLYLWYSPGTHPPGPTGGIGAVTRGRCTYMRELALLDACRPLLGQQPPPELGAAVGGVVTPFRLQEWERALRDHPDKEYMSYLLRGVSGLVLIERECP